jgi:hypothetical protein
MPSRAAEYVITAVAEVLIASARTENHRHTVVPYDLHLSLAEALYGRRARDGVGSQWSGGLEGKIK